MGSRARSSGYNHVLAAVQEALGRRKGAGKGQRGFAHQRTSWNCNVCGKFNFEFQNRCIGCGEAPSSTSGHESGKDVGEKTERNGKGGEEGKELKDLRNKLRQLASENKTLRSQKQGGVDDVDGDDDVNGDSNDDVAKVNELQKAVDTLTAQVGADDVAVVELKRRLEAARTKQRAAKPLLAQITAAERRSEKVAKQLESARKAKEELEKEKRDKLAELDAKIRKEQIRFEELTAEGEQLRAELRGLHDRAKQEKETPSGEKGCSTEGKPKSEVDVGTAWATIKEEAKIRAAGPGADPTWAPMVENASA